MIDGIKASDVQFFKAIKSARENLLNGFNDIDFDTAFLIAEEFGVCRGTINKRRAIAKSKLKEAVTKNKNLK